MGQIIFKFVLVQSNLFYQLYKVTCVNLKVSVRTPTFLDAKSLKMLGVFFEVSFSDLHCFCFLWFLFVLGSTFYVRRLSQKTSNLWLTVNITKEGIKKLISNSNLDFLILSSKFIWIILWHPFVSQIVKKSQMTYLQCKKCLEYSRGLKNILIICTFNIIVFLQCEMEKLCKNQHINWLMKT